MSNVVSLARTSTSGERSMPPRTARSPQPEGFILQDAGDFYMCHLEVAPLRGAKLEIEVRDRVLFVRGPGDPNKITRPAFERSLFLPEDIDATDVRARVRNHALFVTVGKKRDRRTRHFDSAHVAA